MTSVHVSPLTALRCRRQPQGAFALVVTLLILSLLVVVAVSYLTSMSNERQTADAFTSKTRAEQAAQAGVDSAEAILAQSFRDFPDSATVWDPHQSQNTGTPSNTAIVNTPYNEGTNLYLRANPVVGNIPDPNDSSKTVTTTVADPIPAGLAATADDPRGNDPNNPACNNFVLPLISGVPAGRARLVSDKNKDTILPAMNLAETDPTKQNFTDLNIRRAAGDLYGVIGSPPGWTGTPAAGGGKGPKPVRALWVPLKDSDGRITGRYAFWMEDESFRANGSLLGNGTAPFDNASRNDANPAKPRSILPSDLTLLGPLTLIGDSNASVDATAIFNTRQIYPNKIYFPDPLGFVHSATKGDGTSAFTTPTLESLRYLLTNQSGALNLTRHGTQRLNLNNVVPNPSTTVGTTKAQVDQVVETLKFHLPYFGERFYRLTKDANASTLNSSTQVPGSPKVSPYKTLANQTDNSEIYYYKVAANLIDYIDADSQPTIIDPGGTIHPAGKPVTALNGSGSSSNEIWAQGKEIAPYLQEAAVRARATVSSAADATGAHPFSLRVDYYLEFWNMSDRDIYASPQTDPTLPNLQGATVRITNQSIWELSPSPYGAVPTNDGTYRLSDGGPETDYEIDLTNGVRLNGSNGSLVAGGVVFRAGTMTVITTDPDCANYVFYGPPGQTSVSTSAVTVTNPATNKPYGTNPSTTYYCPNLTEGTRQYNGKIPSPAKGLEMKFRDQNYTYDYETEVTLCNANGILDSVPFAIDEHWYRSTWYTDTTTTYPDYHDYSYSSCLMGNTYDPKLYFAALPSQLGDPRTNNEQLSIQPYVSSGSGDQSHYIYGTGNDTSLGYYNPSQVPDNSATTASPATSYPWPDYYSLPTPQFPATNVPNPMKATNSPMVVADGALTSIGQLGDVFDPARLPGTSGAITLSRGGGRTFKIGQRDDRYCGDPTGSSNVQVDSSRLMDFVPASNAWASWRLTDLFSIDDPIELPARININGVRRDNGAALLAALQGFKFQPATNSTDPVVHGDDHRGAASPAGATLDPTSSSTGFSQLVNQMILRLNTASPTGGSSNPYAYVPSGPFFERGELGEIGTSTNSVFGMSDPLGTSQAGSSANNSLSSGVDMYKAFDHSREELFRRIAEMICTRGDTFTVYVAGQSISQPQVNGAMKVTGTHRMRVTFRLVPKLANGRDDFHPSYEVDQTSGQPKLKTFNDVVADNRFIKPDHYDAQVLSVTTY